MARQSVDSILKPYIQQLGKIPDQDIADKAGVSRAVTVSYRKKLGIPAYNGHRLRHSAQSQAVVATVEPVIAPAFSTAKPESSENEERSFRGRRSVLDVHAHLVGNLPDADVARMAGVTPENVRTYRSRRGIKANWRHKEEAEAKVEVKTEAEAKVEVKTEAPALPAPPVETVLYTVSIEHDGQVQHYGVLANTLTDAAAKTLKAMAARNLKGEVRGIERLAELLSA